MPPVLPAGADKKATVALLKQVPGVRAYALLLVADTSHPVTKMVLDHWSALHHLTGPRLLLVVFQPPRKWETAFVKHWENQLGASFQQAWADWQANLESGLAYKHLNLTEPRLKPRQLPCLVLFADAKERRAVIRPIPRWKPEELYALFVSMIEAIHECCDHTSPDKRLDCFRRQLSSPSARATAFLGYSKVKAMDYMRKHPATIAVTSLSIATALATANILPLAPAVVSILQAVKDSFSD